ncbi:cation transporting ATPase C-terminal domain-containing protein [Amycolatopsis sp. NPDC006131]|uniref:cation transporting ATPase C-terminal domain-containing protein n=1 Tax=Amycolatopsis sp. NPDC006131 TaxID=3156731 RepID=UPI0033B0DCE1
MTTAVFLGLTMAFEPTEAGLMSRPPRPPSRPLLTRALMRRTGLVSALLVAAGFAGYHWALAAGASLEEARTVAVNVFVAVQIAYLLSCRSLDRTVLRAWPGRNRLLAVGIGLTVLLQAAITYLPAMNAVFHTAPLGLGSWLPVAGAAIAAFVLVELDKVVRAKRTR